MVFGVLCRLSCATAAGAVFGTESLSASVCKACVSLNVILSFAVAIAIVAKDRPIISYYHYITVTPGFLFNLRSRGKIPSVVKVYALDEILTSDILIRSMLRT